MRVRFFLLLILFLVLIAGYCHHSLANENELVMPEPLILPSEDMFKDAIREQQDNVSLNNLPKQQEAHLDSYSSSCFMIKQVTLHNRSLFSSSSLQRAIDKWKKQLEGHCHLEIMLEQDINILNAILYDAGYITSEVGNVDLFAEDEVLDITLNAGKIADVVSQDSTNKPYLLSQIMPIKRGDILNIKDIEQGADNLKSRPNSNAKIELKTSPNHSQETIVSINNLSKRTFSGAFSIDNKEQKKYGSLFGTARFNFGSLFQLNETMAFVLSSDLDRVKSRGIKKQIFFLQVPYQYWRFSLFGYNIESTNNISKELSGSQITRQQQLSFEIQRQFRPSTQRTVSLVGGIQYYTYQNTILDRSISVHQRRSPYITAGIEHNYQFMRGGYLQVKFNYKQSVPIFNAHLSPIESVNGVPIFNFSLNALTPMTFGSQRFFYQPELNVQLTKSDIDGLLDKSTIGGLDSVYGFASGTGYSDMNQLVFRQKLSWMTPIQSHMLFSALDYGSVSEKRNSVIYNKDKYLVGMALGLEGSIKRLSYQVSWGIPLFMPSEKGRTSSQIFFSGQWNY
ncbi:ShlB/FhaC/HecB family hemolysin secretion/activation protein [Proteus myxofaciens]|uniref:Channel-forming transporter/TpsB family cytolysins activator n=1 Tax=Proteus myxofaciens ATCC 19692 TaxID=1354337 RepID=A0A198G1W3_9GAMM|nr:ShlB/FhaC/HecB family hemolysin secretion/activation protein [Proteus myxofaciens]OAT30940.1 channel-forming transporter/TpsB family cytolysins activator [Proteus myxofaciens ATCC 19692]